MRRTILVAVCVLLCAPALTAFSNESIELEGLHLVAWEDVPGGTPTFTGPVSAAILMAWHAEHGYSRLLGDLNGNGCVDEPDTVALSTQFADSMRARDGSVWDPHLVDAVARYVGERYPDAFELWIYDPSFPEEYGRHMGHAFEPGRYPGIAIQVRERPSRQAYVEHLEHDRPGIVGVGYELAANVFAVSRSAQLRETPDGWPVDLASTHHDLFGPGSVWNTFLRETTEYWYFALEEGIPFETLIVLVPIREPEEGPDVPGEPEQPGDEPQDPGDEPGDEPGGEPEQPQDPSPTLLPNLWVTNMDGCWSISQDAREHVIALVSGTVHNGGQAAASNVEVLVLANGVSATLTIGLLPAGSQAGVIFRDLDLGPYDTMSWPVQTSITADPYNQIPEADETNNSTNSAFPKANVCN